MLVFVVTEEPTFAPADSAALPAASVEAAAKEMEREQRRARRELEGLADLRKRAAIKFRAATAELARSRADTRLRYFRELLLFQSQVGRLRRLQARGGSGNGHYGGNAEVSMDVGEAMGRAMVELLKK